MPSRTQETWPHGAIMLDAEHTQFALWAPDAFYVSVELEDGKSLPMLPQGDGWFVIKANCPAGSRYRYCIDGELEVPDPASRAQDGGLGRQRGGWRGRRDKLARRRRSSRHRCGSRRSRRLRCR